MPQYSSENSLVSTVLAPVRLDSGNLVVHDDSGYHNRVDLEDLSYTNRELVNLENAAVNVENSSDVIIGPVTQFNVNGNVTIYQNGQENAETGAGERVVNDGLDKSNSDEGELQVISAILYLKKHLLRNILVSLFIIAVFATVIIVIFTIQVQDYDRNFNETIYSTNIGTHKVFYRNQWAGIPPKITIPLQQASFVVISQSSTRTCNDTKTCIEKMRIIQKQHLSLGYVDIGYNFFIGSDANIYVGRGWDNVSILGNRSMALQVIGNFVFDTFTSDMVDAIKMLVDEGLDLKKISENYKLIGENQTSSKMYLSPGPNIYSEIKKWPHFYSKIVFGINVITG